VQRTGRQESREVSVPKSARQASEIRVRWAWVEPVCWTDRMLSALEEGVKGGVWFSLIDKVYRRANLRVKMRPITRRANGHSIAAIIVRLNPIVRGWFEYFKHGRPTVMRATDGWIRMRLRSILRKRHKGKGRGRGSDHHRWPNHYFAELGLYSLEQAWIEARRSFRCNH